MNFPLLKRKSTYIVTILIVIISIFFLFSFKNEKKLEIVNYTKDFVNSLEGKSEFISAWLDYEKKHKKYLKKIYWMHNYKTVSEEIIRDKINKASKKLPYRLNQMKLISKETPIIANQLIQYIDLKYNHKLHVHIFLAISPLPIDAKTQWYGAIKDAIHINVFHSSYKYISNLKIILSHEFFHELQRQLLEEKKDVIDYESVWGKLIAEGMATYFSGIYNSDLSSKNILFMSNDDYKLVDKKRGNLALELLKVYNSKSLTMLQRYFAYGESNFPPRSGYYIGWLITKRLSEIYSFEKLTSYSSMKLKKIFQEELKSLVENEPAS